MIRRKAALHAAVALLYCIANLSGVAHAVAASGGAPGQTIWICTTGGFQPITVPAGTSPLADGEQQGDAGSEREPLPSACPICAVAKSVAIAPSVEPAFQTRARVAPIAFSEPDAGAICPSPRQRPEVRGPPTLL